MLADERISAVNRVSASRGGLPRSVSFITARICQLRQAATVNIYHKNFDVAVLSVWRNNRTVGDFCPIRRPSGTGRIAIDGPIQELPCAGYVPNKKHSDIKKPLLNARYPCAVGRPGGIRLVCNFR